KSLPLQFPDVGAVAEGLQLAGAFGVLGDLPELVEDRRGSDIVDVADDEDLAEVLAGAGDGAEHLEQALTAVGVERTEDLVEDEEAGRLRSGTADHAAEGDAGAEGDGVALAAGERIERELFLVAVVDVDAEVVVEHDPVVLAVGDLGDELAGDLAELRCIPGGGVAVEFVELPVHLVEPVVEVTLLLGLPGEAGDAIALLDERFEGVLGGGETVLDAVAHLDRGLALLAGLAQVGQDGFQLRRIEPDRGTLLL